MKNTPYTLKIETLNKSFQDSDNLILHACFQILTNFMENEEPGETIDWLASGIDQYSAWLEIQYLYNWWTNDRPMRKGLLDDVPDDYMVIEEDGYVSWQDEKYPHVKQLIEDHSNREAEWYEEDEGHLHRLIALRKYLWT